jgi:rod shape-determining protein MreC
MPLGTLDRTPPPFFRQGPSALTKLVFCSALAVFLMVADRRLTLTQPLRVTIATVLHPVERTLLVPVDVSKVGADYIGGLAEARAARDAAERKLAAQSERAMRADAVAAENDRLRALLELRQRLVVPSIAAEVLYDAPDPFSRKVTIDRGATQGVLAGSPVIVDAGVIGQVTRVYPLHAEVTLVTDRDAAVPVLNPRTQQRSAAFGGAGGGNAMELRFMAANADVQVGDTLVTSGLDGVYPPGLPVATVTKMERKSDAGFARIDLAPAAQPDGIRHVLVLQPLTAQQPARPEPEPATLAEKQAASRKGQGARR